MNLQLVYRYILSLSKNENMFYEKKTTTTTTTTTTGQKKKRKVKKRKFPMAKVEPRSINVQRKRVI